MRFRLRGRRLLLLTSTMGVAATALATGGVASAGAAGHVSVLGPRGSTPTFPVGHAPEGSGAMNLSEDGKLTRFGAISKSRRPATRTVRGKTVAAAGSPTSWIPSVAATAVHSTHPTMLNSWDGLDEFDNQQFAGFSLEPPDQGLCAGNGYVFEQINDVVQVYHSGGAPATSPLYLNTFFGLPDYQFTTDPSCVFDAGLRRWFVTELTLDVDPDTGALTGTDHIDIAVSQTGDPTGGYWYYSIPVTDAGGSGGPRHKDCPCIGDFPHIGTDAHGFYVTTNEYPFSSAGGRYGNNFNGAQIYALSKKDMASGGATPLVHFQSPELTGPGGRHLPAFTVWPALNPGTGYPTVNHGSEYFTSSLAAEEARPDDFNGHADRIGFWQMADTASLETNDPRVYLRRWVLNSENYGVPPVSQQKSGPTPLRQCLVVQCRGDGNPYQTDSEGGLDSSDSRPLTGWYVNGHVVTALDTAMNVGGNLLAGPAWFDIDPGNGSPSIARQGYLGVANNDVIYPAIATDPSGSGAMALTLVGDDHFPSAAYTLWSPTGPGDVFTASEGKAPEDGFCEYAFYNCAGTATPTARPRWGDYGGATWDGKNVFLGSEYIAHSCSFAQFDSDTTCGGTRTYYGNFSTRITKLAAGG